MRYLACLVVLAALAGGCGNKKTTYTPTEPKPIEPANVPAGQEAILFPMAVGNSWRYDVSMTQLTAAGAVPQKADYVLEVKEVTDIEGGKRAKLEVKRGDVLQDRQTWRIDKTGIYQEELGLEQPRKSDGQPAFVFPIEIGKPYEWSGTAPAPGGTIRPLQATVETKGVEEVDALIGTVSAYRVETTQRFKDDKGNDIVALSVVYWAPNIGIVRQRQEVKSGTTILQQQLMILKQYTIK